MTDKTFDTKRAIKPLHLEDVDRAFHAWWNETLNLHLTRPNKKKIKVPVHFVAPERWNSARTEGFRDQNGTIILPVIAISRTSIGTASDAGLSRIVADTRQEFSYHKQIHPKSSLIKELVKNRESTIDPSLPIYEVFTSRVPDHYSITYEVSIWVPYFGDMNEVIEKVGQAYDYLSVKCLTFKTPDGFYYRAFQDDELIDQSNLDDYTDDERIIRRDFVYNVPAYIMPDDNSKNGTFKRRLTQTKLVIKKEYAATPEEVEELFGK